MTVSDYLSNLQTLAQQNLELLKTINESFYTNNSHLTTTIGDNTFVIPSFLSLENKINALQDGFNNLVNAPLTGEAYFNFDGNSKAIELRGFNCAPAPISLGPVNSFNVESNDIFKDFLTPVPYINFDVNALPDDITEILVKKVIPLNSELVEMFRTKLSGSNPSVSCPWSDIYEMLAPYTEDTDYIMYDTRENLPVKQPTGSAQYVIYKILSDEITEDLEEYIEVQLKSVSDQYPGYTDTLTYKLFDGTIEKNLKPGDILITSNNSSKLEIVETRPVSSVLKLKVLNGEYLNLVPSDGSGSGISDLSVLKFFSPVDLNQKEIHIPLEEDRYIYVALAGINSRLRIQAPWGNGVIIDTNELNLETGRTKFNEYYKDYVRNIGDILKDITHMTISPLSKYTMDEIRAYTAVKPIIDTNSDHLIVTQINKHLDNSETVKNIRSLYSQKKDYEAQLNSIQSDIDNINQQLANISFDDTIGNRNSLQAELESNNKSKNSIVSSISKIINSISQSVNNSDVPIENAKYHIRGYVNTAVAGIDYVDVIKNIEVWYRYKNSNLEQGNVESIGDFIYSDWNIMDNVDRPVVIDGNNSKLIDDNKRENEPSFNQIDIPISQGESIDIKLRFIYSIGYPFVKVYSDWSDIVNVVFPEEYTKNIQILDIISENNNDIETNRFENILKDLGIVGHVEDELMDQDVKYFHKPENIASGFYTTERRVIPLKTKLEELSNTVQTLIDEVEGTAEDSIKASIVIGNSETVLEQNSINNISVAAVTEISDESSLVTDGVYEKDTNGLISTVLQLTLQNTSSHVVKLFSLFPGPRTESIRIYKGRPCVIDPDEYSADDDSADNLPRGVWSKCYDDTEDDSNDGFSIQKCNQFIYFRIKDAWDRTDYYKDGDVSANSNELSLDKEYVSANSGASQLVGAFRMWAYPSKNNEYSFSLKSNNTYENLTLRPDESIVIPIIVEYYGQDATTPQISKIMSFDLRPSLYKDPITYTFKIIAKYEPTAQDKLIRNVKIKDRLVKYNPIIKS